MKGKVQHGKRRQRTIRHAHVRPRSRPINDNRRTLKCVHCGGEFWVEDVPIVVLAVKCLYCRNLTPL